MLKIYYSNVVSEAFFYENYENILKQKVLHTTRIKKINKIKNSSERCRSLSVGLLASFAFRQEKIDVSEIEIVFGKNNKPVIENENIFYNVSHTNGVCIVAISDEPVGIDTETIRERWLKNPKKLEHLAKKILTEKEYDVYFNIEDLQKKAEFFTCIWTKKESFVKENGKGITCELSQIPVIDNKNIFSSKIKLSDDDDFPSRTKLSDDDNFSQKEKFAGYFYSCCSKQIEGSSIIETQEVDLNNFWRKY